MVLKTSFVIAALMAPSTLAFSQIAGIDPATVAATATDTVSTAVSASPAASTATGVVAGVTDGAVAAAPGVAGVAASPVGAAQAAADATAVEATAAFAPAMWSANNVAAAEAMSSEQVAAVNVMVQTGSETVMMNSGRFTQPEWQTDQARTLTEAEPMITGRPVMTKAQLREQLAIIRY